MKRIIASVILVLSLYGLNAQTTYYVDAIDGNDGNNGTSSITPWKTISKVNSTAGASSIVRFKRGLTFYGSLAPGAATMTFDTYGSGALPVISGGVESNAWVDAGSGRFYISGVTVKPKVVVINGRQYARGRTPDNGFWNQDAVTSGGGNATVTANELSGFNWTGATIVHRPERWIINNETITSHTGSVIDFSYLYYAPKQDYKFFITDDLDCVTAYGEWYWDDPTDRLYVYFGSSGTSPVTYSVTNNPLLVSTAGCTFRNLNFAFANEHAARVNASQNVTFDGCSFTFSYDGIYLGAGNSNNLKIQNCTFRFINNNGVKTEDGSCDGLLMEYNDFHQIGAFYGEGGNNDGMYQGFNGGGGFIATGPTTNATIRFNVMDTVGYVGIGIGGQNTLIQNNIIRNFCFLKDDGGAIYGSGHGTNKRWTGNIITDGAVNAWQGTADQNIFAYGLYLDNNNKYYTLDNNTLINVPTAIFVHDGQNATVRDNVVFNSKDKGLMIWKSGLGDPNDPGFLVRNLNVKKNLIVGSTTTERILNVENLFDADDIGLWGTIDSNFYMRPLDDNLKIYYGYGSGTVYNMAGWRAAEGHDLNSSNAIKTFSSSINAADSIKIYYNATNAVQNYAIPGRWIDHLGVVYNNNVSVSPYRSVVLFADGATGTPPPPTATGSVGWQSPIDSDYEPLPGQESVGGIRKKTTSAQGWDNGWVKSTQAITEGESFEFAVGYRSDPYIAVALSATDPIEIVGVPSVLFGLRGGNTTPPQTESGIVPHEAGADISSAYQAYGVDSPWYRIKYQGGQIKYGKSVDGGATFTDFYTSTITPSGSYYLYFSGYDPGDMLRIVRRTGVSTPVNQTPTVSAGTDRSVQLPTSTAQLSGTGADADGTIVSIIWTKISGPAGGTIQSANALTTNINSLQVGDYVYNLTVTDNVGASASDQVNVTVIPSPVGVPPTANAGGNIAVRLPATSTILYGNNSSAPPGTTITAYAWTKISGPSGSILTTPSASITNLTNLVAGQYVYRLTVTASNGLTSTSDAVITVSATTTRKKRVFVRHN